MNNNNTATWQKLSPIAIIYFVLHFIVRFVKDGLINIAPAFAIWVTQVENKLFWFASGASVLALILVTYATLYYFNFRYKVTEHEIILRKGVFKKENNSPIINNEISINKQIEIKDVFQKNIFIRK